MGKARLADVAGDQGRQLLRHGIVQPLDQGGIEAIGIIVEKPLDIGAWRLWRRLRIPEKREFQSGAENIVGVQFQNPLQGLRRGLFPAGFLLIVGEPEPAGRPVWNEFQRLPHQVGGIRMVAALGKHVCVLGAAVGDQVAGGQLMKVHEGTSGPARLKWQAGFFRQWLATCSVARGSLWGW